MTTLAVAADILGTAHSSAARTRSARARTWPARQAKEPGSRDEHWSQLMARAQNGDGRAFECLLREIVPSIRVTVRRWHHAPDRVEDVVQEVLLAVHRAKHTYDSARPFRLWLAAIARRRAIDALRRSSRSRAAEICSAAADSFCQSFADRAVEGFEGAWATADHLSRAIANLPATQREAIELIKLRDMSLADAAKLTGRSVVALRVNTHRALKSLRQGLLLA
jgi:RNA polymerase sigma-70 factor, ECF subfamily